MSMQSTEKTSLMVQIYNYIKNAKENNVDMKVL